MPNYITPTIGTGAVSGSGDEALNVPELYLYDTVKSLIGQCVVPLPWVRSSLNFLRITGKGCMMPQPEGTLSNIS